MYIVPLKRYNKTIDKAFFILTEVLAYGIIRIIL
nr:MAG TPA: hypothetical protein [Caudoviricetes sp.]